MPELPEVETMVRQIRPHVRGAVLRRVVAHDPLLEDAAERVRVPTRARALGRRGKYVLLRTEAQVVSVHLRMSGRLVWSSARPPEGRVRMEFVFSGGTVYFVDTRRLGMVEVGERFRPRLGREPFGELRWLPRALAGSRRPLKLWLMDQSRIAGLGNIYAAEACHRAGIDPRRPAGSLSRTEGARLARAIRDVLDEAIDEKGSTLRDGGYRDARGALGGFQFRMAVYGREGHPCPRCGTPVQRVVQGGRSTYLCPGCQS